jgi:uncharacterized protein YqeY
MSLTETINEEIKKAMLAKNEAGLRALRAVKSALLLLKAEKGNASEITQEEENKLLQKLVKQRKESIEIYNTQGRADLAKSEIEEVEIIDKFLPKQLGEAEIRDAVKKIISDLGATSQADLGKVMGAASKHFAGSADNKMVSAIVRELLS